MSVCERHLICFLLAAWLWCACFSARSADELLEPQAINTTAKTLKSAVSNEVRPKTPSRLRKAYAPLPADPVYDIELKWREADAAGAINSVSNENLRGENAHANLDGMADWHFPREESAISAVFNIKPSQAGEPEQVRFSADTEESANRPFPEHNHDTQSKSADKFLNAITAADPENSRFADLADLQVARPVSKAMAPNINAELLPAQPVGTPVLARNLEESPRIASGGGLDKDDLKPVAAVVAPLNKIDPTTLPAEAAIPPAPIQSALAAVKADSHKWSAHDSLTVASKPNQTKAPLAKVDPEARTAQLIKEIFDIQKHHDEVMKELSKTKKPVLNPQNGNLIRDDHERNVFSTLKDEKRPIGAVAVKVFDPVTKQLLTARVKITDSTETTARAPLADGFWCRGSTPPINVVSGLVHAEIHRGRFFSTFVKGLEVKAGLVEQVEVPMWHPPYLNFEKRGWVLADLDLGLRKQADEKAVWFGAPPSVNDLILSARAEGVRIVGVTLPLGDEKALASLRTAFEKPNPDVLLIPVFPGPRSLFNGTGHGLGVTTWEGLKPASALPEVPLCEGFDAIRARGGLAVYKSLNGMRKASIENEILPLYRRLKESNYFAAAIADQAHIYSAAEFPFDTVTGAYDVLAFDGSDAMESVWFNLLNESAPVRVIGAGGGSLEGGRIPYGQTFLQIDGAPTRDKAMDAIQAGRTAVSFGPAVFCKVYERDMGPGSVLPTDGRPLSLQIQAYSTLAPGAQLDKIEIIRNGVVVFTQTAAEGESELQDLRWPFSEAANSWYVVRVTERVGHNGASNGIHYSKAWTSPIFFKSNATPKTTQCMAHVRGSLRRGLTPVRGVVTALALGMPTQRVESGPDGSFSISLPATGTLIFEAPDCEPLAKRIFEHPAVQSSIGKLMCSNNLQQKLADRPIFGLWRLMLSDLDWDVSLAPCTSQPQPAQLPEPQ